MPLIYGPDNKPVSGFEDMERTTEVVRSFSFKLNLHNYGGNQYESADFFCSQKTTCKVSQAEDASLALYQFARAEVLKSAREHVADMKQRKTAQSQRSHAA